MQTYRCSTCFDDVPRDQAAACIDCASVVCAICATRHPCWAQGREAMEWNGSDYVPAPADPENTNPDR